MIGKRRRPASGKSRNFKKEKEGQHPSNAVEKSKDTRKTLMRPEKCLLDLANGNSCVTLDRIVSGGEEGSQTAEERSGLLL